MNSSDHSHPDHSARPLDFSPADPATHGVIQRAAEILGRKPSCLDRRNYQCRLLAASLHEPTGRLAYLESREKLHWWAFRKTVMIKVHLRDGDGKDRSVDIETYNPFFGCTVDMLEWIDETAVLIYEEKHHTYVCTFGPHWPPRFVAIEDYWIIKDGVLGYRGYQQNEVQRLSVPDLTPLEPLSLTEAEETGLVPVDVYDQNEE